MYCKGICEKKWVRGKKYAQGYKFCSTCRTWEKNEDSRCNCCRNKFRVATRGKRANKVRVKTVG